MHVFKKQLYNWWRLMRVRAVPHSHHNVDGMAKSRSQRRKPRHAGLHCGCNVTLEQRAASAAQGMWEYCRKFATGIWIGNWFKDRFTTTLGDSNHSMDVTVVEGLHNPAPTAYGGHMTPMQLAQAMFVTAARVCNFLPRLQGVIAVAVDGSMRRDWIQVPLHFVQSF